ncbi:hypothetical protein [Tenacibaculum sp. SG-28]|uniref:hypothetical protein n=1 Tax=Tenacibaculum sp. SG-28 TaxID=754426 RepID=UPI000CF36B9A|nr:hypothetical protein [Tenacibaculum sp. SG-28]PQJ21484.1 hypothetical protein BSU00_04955 [Tenacibaculum sp. SG-28]
MRLIKIIFFLVLSNAIIAQEITESKPDNSIKNQFETLYKKSGSYQEYKVVKKTAYAKLQKNVLDTLKNIESKVVSQQKNIVSQKSNITILEEKIKELNNTISDLSDKQDDISLFGLSFAKTSFKLGMAILTGILLFLLFLFIYKFKNSNTVTKETIKMHNDIEKELEDFRKNAIEKEQKLRRKLQDEINKQRGV